MRVVVAFAMLTLVGAVFAQEEAPPRPPPAQDEVARLIERLGAEEWSERQAARKALAEKGLAVTGRLFEALSRAEDPEVRASLGELLDGLHYPTPDAVAEIEKAVEEYRGLREKGLERKVLLEKSRGPVNRIRRQKHAAHWMVERLADAEDARRKAVAELLAGVVGEADDGNMVFRGAGPGVRVQRVVVVVGPGGKKRVRVWKNGKLVSGGEVDPDATPLTALLRVLESSDDDYLLVRALRALGALGDKHAVGGVVALLKKESVSGEVLAEGLSTLAKLTGNSFTGRQSPEERWEAWRKWWEQNKDDEAYRPPAGAGGDPARPAVDEEDFARQLRKSMEKLRRMMQEELQKKRVPPPPLPPVRPAPEPEKDRKGPPPDDDDGEEF